MLPWRDIFLTSYKVLSLNLSPFKTKETIFQTLNRIIWTCNKILNRARLQTQHAYAVRNQKPWNTASMHVQIILPRYGHWLVAPLCTLALSCRMEDYIPSITLTSLETITSPLPSSGVSGRPHLSRCTLLASAINTLSVSWLNIFSLSLYISLSGHPYFYCHTQTH
jgi:hypothetical protein